jgi:hypothetical protein
MLVLVVSMLYLAMVEQRSIENKKILKTILFELNLLYYLVRVLYATIQNQNNDDVQNILSDEIRVNLSIINKILRMRKKNLFLLSFEFHNRYIVYYQIHVFQD